MKLLFCHLSIQVEPVKYRQLYSLHGEKNHGLSCSDAFWTILFSFIDSDFMQYLWSFCGLAYFVNVLYFLALAKTNVNVSENIFSVT